MLTEIFVDPIHKVNLYHRDKIKQGHSCRIYHHYIKTCDDLTVSNLNQELRSNIKILIVLLKSLESFFRIASAPLI